MKKAGLVLLLVCLFPALVYAQGGDGTPETGVYVTTQDFSSLRAGPGVNFERLAVVDPAVTLPATGRTADARWVQVTHAGQRGWIAARLLVWSGDLISLPIDGIEPPPFVRRAGVMGITTRETPIFRRELVPQDQVGTLPAGTRVELTGRLGSRGFFRFQILYEGALYWVGSWNIRLIAGSRYLGLLDASYLYAYGRLVTQLDRDLADGFGRLSQIEDIWRRLDAGQRVSCGFIPAYFSRRTTDSDLRREPIFAPLAVALDGATAHLNAAISAFADACGRAEGDGILTQQEVDAALDEIDSARRSLNLARSLLNSLQLRDPFLNPQ